jgi:3-dehydroquinate synthase
VASVYLRGIDYGFVPATLLSQVDAAIGGKNGINFSLYKNMIGIIRQPRFLLFDHELLQTLPPAEWYNGFAEIIKYACICDASLFEFLEVHAGKALAFDRETISYLVKRSAQIKSEIVQADEFEQGQRRLLNFGHTIGHAVEKLERVPHGQAVAKGMAAAAELSRLTAGLPGEEKQRIVHLIERYHLPSGIHSEADAIARYFRMDKKRENSNIHFILLKRIGEAFVKPIALDELAEMLKQLIGEKV